MHSTTANGSHRCCWTSTKLPGGGRARPSIPRINKLGFIIFEGSIEAPQSGLKLIALGLPAPDLFVYNRAPL